MEAKQGLGGVHNQCSKRYRPWRVGISVALAFARLAIFLFQLLVTTTTVTFAGFGLMVVASIYTMTSEEEAKYTFGDLAAFVMTTAWPLCGEVLLLIAFFGKAAS